MLRHLPAVDKTVALSIQSIMHLTFIEYFTTRNDVSQITHKLRHCDLDPQHYTFPRFCQPCAVYIKLPIDWKKASKQLSCQQNLWSYVGSAAAGVVAREQISSKHSLVSLYKWSLLFGSGQQKATIPSLRSLSWLLFRTIDLPGFESMP